MNTLAARIVRITSSGHASLVEADAHGTWFSAVVLETPSTADYLREGRAISLLFKETELLLSLDPAVATTAGNAFRCRVTAVTRGAVVSDVSLDAPGGRLESVLTTAALDALGLVPGVEVTAFVSPFELSILG